ncbi:MAG: LamG domain-containing protein, partial [Bacteroidaceae bacterium]|nr:LamG domain-containing protein [Bacteroidaceae bacterium]
LYARAETPVGGGTPSFFYNSFLSGSQRRASAGSLQPGTWQHVAIVCDPVSQSITYFINGERDCTVSTGAFETCTGGFRIGGHKSGKNYFKGYIDDAWFFKGLLSPEQIRQIRDNTFNPTPYYPDSSGSESASTEWPLKDHVYTIRNYSSTPAYMVDNEESDNRITCEGSTSNAAYWVFEPTDNAHSYYVRNYTSGRYIQDYTNASGQMVAMGNEKVEYYVQASESEGGRYGFASTSVSPHDFSSGTIGLNLRAESNQANCYVQTYAAAAGTNHRSFWTLTAVPDITIGIDRPVVDNEQWQTGNGQISTLNGITVDGKWANGHPGIYIQNGRKVARRRVVR